jgi:hypothetical protein
MIVYVLFVHKKSVSKRKVCIIFKKNFKNQKKTKKKPKKNIFCGFLGGFFGFFWVGFFGWVFYCHPDTNPILSYQFSMNLDYSSIKSHFTSRFSLGGNAAY